MIVAESMALSYSINSPGVTPGVAPAIDPAVTPLLTLGLIAESVDLSQSINDPAVTTAITPAITPAATPLLLLGLFMVIASRGRIWVTVFICDCQARESSSSEGCSTLQKTVKVEPY